jgi:hypothetical protein
MSQPGVSQTRFRLQDLLSAKRSKSLILWCRGPESNRYAPFETQDFKSYFVIFTNPRLINKVAVLKGLPQVFSLGLSASEIGVSGASVSRVSAKS